MSFLVLSWNSETHKYIDTDQTGESSTLSTGDLNDAQNYIVMMSPIWFIIPKTWTEPNFKWIEACLRSEVYIIRIFDDWSNLIHQKGKDHFLDFPFMVSSNFFVASLIIEMTIGTFNFHTSWLISFELKPCKIRAQPVLLISQPGNTGHNTDITRWRSLKMPIICRASGQADSVWNVFLRIGGLVPRKMSEATGGGLRWSRKLLCSVSVSASCPCLSLSPLSLVSCQSVLLAIFIILHNVGPTHIVKP